jgi:hypothetical protein
MIHYEASRLKTIAKQYEPFLIFRVIRVIEQTGILVQKSGLHFVEGTPCFVRFDRALLRSHANPILPTALFAILAVTGPAAAIRNCTV